MNKKNITEYSNNELMAMSKEEIITLAREMEYKFTDSNIQAVELIDEIEMKNEELEQTTKELKAFSSIIKNSLNQIYILNESNFKFLFANHSAIKDVGYPLGELVEMTFWDLKSDYSPEEFEERIKDLLSNKRNSYKFEAFFRRRDGTEFPVEIQLQKCDFHGKPSLVAMVLDRTREKELSKQLLRSSKMAIIGELAAGVGHEINNPLTISSGNILLIQEELENDKYERLSVYEKLEKIKHGHERIRRIVDGLRTYARADADHQEVISINEAIEQTVSMISEIYEREGIKIIKLIPELIFCTRGSIGKLQQVIMNLISNAKDATEGQEKREICISLKKNNEESILFSVQDNGCGIPEKIKDKILNPFFTTKEIGKGTGMGLGVVKEIVETMKGELKIESEEGKGSSFNVTIPLVESDALLKQQEQQQLQLQSQQDNPLSGVALVIDDEKGIRELLRYHLEDLGLEVEEADDGDMGLEKIKEKKYDYICTDMKMKRMQGEDFIRAARTLPNGDTGYFIITGGVTTNYSEEQRDELYEIADGYILKPFTEQSIYATLSKYRKK